MDNIAENFQTLMLMNVRILFAYNRISVCIEAYIVIVSSYGTTFYNRPKIY